jgi:hypothetical protein
MGKKRIWRGLMGKGKARDHLEDQRRRWDDDVKMDLEGIECKEA